MTEIISAKQEKKVRNSCIMSVKQAKVRRMSLNDCLKRHTSASCGFPIFEAELAAFDKHNNDAMLADADDVFEDDVFDIVDFPLDRGFSGRDRGYGGDRGFERAGSGGSGGFDRGFGGDRDGGRRFGSGYGRDREGGDRSSFNRYGDRDNRGGGFGDRRGYSPPRDRMGDRDRGFSGGRDSPPKERPKLALQPRSKPADAGSADSRSSIFGDAKPVDTTRFEEMSRNERMKDTKEAAPRSQQSYEGRRERDYPRDGDQRPDDETANRGPPGERPRLNLQKRSKPLEDGSNKSESKAASIFGAAKPVDTAAREREIEVRLQRERELEQQDLVEKDNRERRLSSTEHSSRSSRTRNDSNNSNEGEKRSRKLSSSSSGKGIRTVAPPPGVGSARVRRDSTLSDQEDNVFDEEHNAGPPSKSPKSPPANKDEPPPKMVPAPPPKENIWEKRKASQPISPPAKSEVPTETNRPPVEKQASQEDRSKDKENMVPAPTSADSAWKKGKPDLVPAGTPTENVWEKRKKSEQQSKPPSNSGLG